MRILLDTNIILDVLLNREPHVHDSRRLWPLADQGEFEGNVAAFTWPTIHSICKRQAGAVAADNAIDICLEAFEVCALCIQKIIRVSRHDSFRKIAGSGVETIAASCVTIGTVSPSGGGIFQSGCGR